MRASMRFSAERMKTSMPAQIVHQLRLLVRKGYLTRAAVATQGVLIVLTVVFEAIGLSLLVPILKMIESGQTLAELAATSRFWTHVNAAFRVLGLPSSLFGMLAVVFAAITLRQVVRYVGLLSISKQKQLVEKALCLDLYTAALKASPSALQEIGTGRFTFIINNLSNGAATIIRTHAAFFSSALVCAVYLGISIPVAPIPTLIGIGLAGTVLLLMTRFAAHARRLSAKGLALRQAFQNHLSERYRNWRIVKLTDSIQNEVDQLVTWNERIFRMDLANTRVSALTDLTVVPTMTGMTLLILFFSVEVLHIHVSQIALLVMVLIRLEPVVRSFSQQRQSLERFGVQFDEAFRCLDELHSNREIDRGTTTLSSCQRGIEYRGISFRYPGSDNNAVEHVSLVCPAGLVTALIGPSGSGKSTLVDLLVRLQQAQAGEILIDGVNIEQFSLLSLRRGIAFVSQRAVLFDMTVRENICYGLPPAPEKAILAAAELANASDFIQQLPSGLDTKIGESGAKLSGGQQQRLGLARAFLSDAPILILDEPTSALDYESEARISEAIEMFRRRGGKTVIIIAHRASTVMSADRIVVIQRGQIEDIGSPAELAGRDGWFRRMTEHQNATQITA
jgi:ATP-binding cassette, subfamily B, bacterial MsbA